MFICERPHCFNHVQEFSLMTSVSLNSFVSGLITSTMDMSTIVVINELQITSFLYNNIFLSLPPIRKRKKGKDNTKGDSFFFSFRVYQELSLFPLPMVLDQIAVRGLLRLHHLHPNLQTCHHPPVMHTVQLQDR